MLPFVVHMNASDPSCRPSLAHETRRWQKRFLWPLGMVVVAVMGPYVVAGWNLRLEQIVIYPLGLVAILLLVMRGAALPKSFMVMQLAWIATTVAGTLMSLLGPVATTLPKLLGGLDDMVMPLLLSAIVALAFTTAPHRNNRAVSGFVTIAIQWCLLG